MIKNERQYESAKSYVQSLQEVLQSFETCADFKALHPVFQQAHKKAISSLIEEKYAQLKEYDKYKSATAQIDPVERWKDVPLLLIRTRIQKNMSEYELAQCLGTTEEEIEDWEEEEYMTASREDMLRIAAVLGIAFMIETLTKL